MKPSRTTKDFVPKWILNSCKTRTQIVDSKSLATIENRNDNPRFHIVFFHGGSFVFEMLMPHWFLLKKFLSKLSCRISVVDYPLAPEHNYKDTFAMVGKSYDLLTEQFPDDRFVLMGDSAGGGLALAFAQSLFANNHAVLPEKIVLLSPWLDLTVSNPMMEEIAHLDLMLSFDLLRPSAKAYSGGDDLSHFLLSPINGDLVNLPETAVFYSSHELIGPDCMVLKSRAENVSARMRFYEYEGMPHDWCIFPIPEAEKAIGEVCEFIKK